MDATVQFRSLRVGEGAATSLPKEALYLAAGVAVTFGLFAAMARLESADRSTAAPEIEELRSVSALYEPPPPAVIEHPQEHQEILPLTGLDIAVSDSPVRIAVVPPDLAQIIPATDIPPRADVQFDQLYTDLKPRVGGAEAVERIYQPNEVDKKPAAIVKTIAHVSRIARDDADELGTTLELVINAAGDVESIRVLRSSGNAEFDTIMLHCLKREWTFSPAIKNGKAVKCIVIQNILYKWSHGDPFKT